MSSPTLRLDTIEDAIAAIKSGRPVVVMDDEDRENEGDLIMAAEHATPEAITFFVRHTSGVICAPLTSDRLGDGGEDSTVVFAHGVFFSVASPAGR